MPDRREIRERRRDRHRNVSLDTPRENRRQLLVRPDFDPDAFGRASEAFARFMGTGRFLVYMSAFVALWLAWNTFAPASVQFDPRALNYTLLTLILSLQASYAAPLILLAQNRQADRDRLSLEEDRRRARMQKADTEYLAREIAALRIAVGEVATRDYLRSELARMADELDEAAARREKRARKAGRKKDDGEQKPDEDEWDADHT